MHGDKVNAATRYHIAGNGAVNAAGEQRYRASVRADGHTARTRQRLAVNISRALSHLYMDSKLGVVNIDLHLGKFLAEQPANVLGKLNAGHGKRLVRALSLHLEAFCLVKRLRKIGFCGFKDGILILIASHRPRNADHAEKLGHRVKRAVHVAVVALRLNINR